MVYMTNQKYCTVIEITSQNTQYDEVLDRYI